MGQLITCISVGIDTNALTRGRKYELVAQDETNHQVRVRCDNGRLRWFDVGHFDMLGGSAPILNSWRFDDPVIDILNHRDQNNNWVEVSFELSDGTRRWCSFVTPDYLKWLLEERSDPIQWSGAYEPAVWSSHTIVIRDLAIGTVDWILKYLDQQGELLSHSLPLDQAEEL